MWDNLSDDEAQFIVIVHMSLKSSASLSKSAHIPIFALYVFPPQIKSLPRHRYHLQNILSFLTPHSDLLPLLRHNTPQHDETTFLNLSPYILHHIYSYIHIHNHSHPSRPQLLFNLTAFISRPPYIFS